MSVMRRWNISYTYRTIHRELLPSHVIVTNPLLSMITLPSSSRLNQPFIFVDGMMPRSPWPYNREARSRLFRTFNPGRSGRSLSSRLFTVSYFRALFRCTFCTSDISAAESVRRCSGCKYMYVRAESLRRVDGNVRVPYDEETEPVAREEVRSEKRSGAFDPPPETFANAEQDGGAIEVTDRNLGRQQSKLWQALRDILA